MKLKHLIEALKRFPENSEYEMGMSHMGLRIKVDNKFYHFSTPTSQLPWTKEYKEYKLQQEKEDEIARYKEILRLIRQRGYV